MSKLNRIKRDIDHNFTTINNIIVKDVRISLKARGFYLTIMSLPDSWDFSVRGITAVLPDGKSAVYGAINELIHYGYCTRQRIYEGNRIAYMEYIFHQIPIEAQYDGNYQELETGLHPGFLHPGFQELENRTQLRTKGIKDLTNSSSLRSELIYNGRVARPDATREAHDSGESRKSKAGRSIKESRDSAHSLKIQAQLEQLDSLFNEPVDNNESRKSTGNLPENGFKVSDSEPLPKTMLFDAPRLAKTTQEPGQIQEFSQPKLPGILSTRSKRSQGVTAQTQGKVRITPVSVSIADEFARICYLAATHAERTNLLSKAQWGQIHNTIRSMQAAGVDLTKLNQFERWWAGNFRSKDRITGRYQPPRPGQIRELWLESVKDRHLQSPRELKQVDAVADDILAQVFKSQSLKRR